MLTTTAQHALRALGDLADLEVHESRGGDELAHRAQVPVSYLRKILHALGRAGLVTARRGARGGYRLARPPSELRLADVVTALAPDALAARCLLDSSRACSQQRDCPVHERWREVRTHFESFLTDMTLDELAAGHARSPDGSIAERGGSSDPRGARCRSPLERPPLTLRGKDNGEAR